MLLTAEERDSLKKANIEIKNGGDKNSRPTDPYTADTISFKTANDVEVTFSKSGTSKHISLENPKTNIHVYKSTFLSFTPNRAQKIKESFFFNQTPPPVKTCQTSQPATADRTKPEDLMKVDFLTGEHYQYKQKRDGTFTRTVVKKPTPKKTPVEEYHEIFNSLPNYLQTWLISAYFNAELSLPKREKRDDRLAHQQQNHARAQPKKIPDKIIQHENFTVTLHTGRFYNEVSIFDSATLITLKKQYYKPCSAGLFTCLVGNNPSRFNAYYHTANDQYETLPIDQSKSQQGLSAEFTKLVSNLPIRFQNTVLTHAPDYELGSIPAKPDHKPARDRGLQLAVNLSKFSFA